MANNLKVLVQQRGSVKGRLTRLQTFIDSDALEELNYHDICVRHESLKDLFERVNKLQNEIVGIIESDNEIAEHEEWYVQFENIYFVVKARLENILQSYAESENEMIQTRIETQEKNIMVNNKRNVNLPKITLPTFDGNFSDWLVFKDTFSTLIHNDPKLQAIEKFHYLKSSVEGEASKIINKIILSTQGYTTAWNALLERYDNTRRLIDIHVRSLFNLQPIYSESASQLQALVDDYTVHLRALESLEQPTQHWDTLIIHLITSRLDTETNKNWEFQLQTNEPPTLAQLTAFLQNRARILESIKTNDHSLVNKSKITNENKQIKKYTKTFVTTGNDNKLCTLCHSSHQHKLYKCQKFEQASVPQR